MPTKAINIRLPEELYEYLQKRAEKEHRTLSNLVISILLDEKEGSWRIEAFQGRSNINENDDYCGDTNLVDADRITLQIHHIALQGLSVADAPNGKTYVLAFHFPEKLQAQYNANVTVKYNITE